MSSNQNFIQKNILNSIQGRLILFATVFVSALIALNILSYVQGNRDFERIKKIREVKLPLSLLTSRLLSEANNTSSAQRAYIITKNSSFKIERLETWEYTIHPLLDSLNTYKDKPETKNIKDDLEKAMLLIKKYEDTQNKIDKYFEDNFDAFNLNINANDSAFATRVITAIQLQSKVNRELNQWINQDARALVQDIQDVLLPIIDTQENELQIQISEVVQSARLSIIIGLFVSMLLVFGIIIFSYFIIKSLQQSILKPISLLNKLAQGKIVKSEDLVNNELDEVILASNKLSQNLQKASEFAKSIGKGDFDTNFQPDNEEDVLGNALVQMRQRLKEVAEDDRRRSWVSEGLTKFGDLIRTNSDSLHRLSDIFLSELIEYLGANQGGVFISRLEDERSEYIASLDLIAYYAYDRKKYQNKVTKVHPHYAGDLVGQTFLEKEKIYLKEIPDNYINITSGLGDAPPSYLLLIPLKVNEKVEGVLELASFQAFEPHQVLFIETIGETFAASITAVKVAEHTQVILNDLQEKTESLQAQEEEMRQNMEELTVTQEQMKLKQTELETLKANLEIEVNHRTKELNESLTRFNLINRASSEGLWDMTMPHDGIVSQSTYFYWSPQLKNILGYTEQEFPNKLSSWFGILHSDDTERVSRAFIEFIKDTSDSIEFREEHRLRLKSGDYAWFIASAQAIRNRKGKAIRVAGYINNITDSKDLEIVLEELKEQKEVLEKKQIELETTNKKMKGNELILKKALEKNREKEKEIAQNNQLLSDTKKRFERLMENTPGVLYQYEMNLESKKGKYIFITQYIEDVLGYSPKEFLEIQEDELDEIIHGAEKKEFYRKFNEATKFNKRFEWEGRMLSKDKIWKWVKVNATPHQEGSTVLFNGLLTDVTLRRQQEERLKKLNDNLKKSEEELRSNLIELHKTQQEMEHKNTQLAEMNQRVQSNEKILIKAFQKVKEKEEQIKYKNQEMQAVLDASLDSIFTIDRQGLIQNVNQMAEKIFGYTKEEMLGKNISMMMPEPDHSQHDQYLKNYQETGIKKILNSTRVTKAKHKDGSVFDVTLSILEVKVLDKLLYTGFIRKHEGN